MFTDWWVAMDWWPLFSKSQALYQRSCRQNIRRLQHNLCNTAPTYCIPRVLWEIEKDEIALRLNSCEKVLNSSRQWTCGGNGRWRQCYCDYKKRTGRMGTINFNLPSTCFVPNLCFKLLFFQTKRNRPFTVSNGTLAGSLEINIIFTRQNQARTSWLHSIRVWAEN